MGFLARHMHKWAVIERRFNWTTGTHQFCVWSTHKTEVAAKARATHPGLFVRASRHVPAGVQGAWWPQ